MSNHNRFSLAAQDYQDFRLHEREPHPGKFGMVFSRGTPLSVGRRNFGSGIAAQIVNPYGVGGLGFWMSGPDFTTGKHSATFCPPEGRRSTEHNHGRK
jgi:hypothetical protein